MIKISSRDKIIYTAILLDSASKDKIRSTYPGIHEIYFGGHVTLFYGKDELHPQHGKQVQFVADGYSSDDKVEALAVNIGSIENDRRMPHVTISAVLGVPPQASNDLLSREIKKIPPIPLSGRITAYSGGKFI